VLLLLHNNFSDEVRLGYVLWALTSPVHQNQPRAGMCTVPNNSDAGGFLNL
jgi:hypothetical protein